MARRVKEVNVYERIESKKAEIKEAEEVLKKLNEELKVLFAEKDDQEMRLLFEQMRSNGLEFSQAIELLNKK